MPSKTCNTGKVPEGKDGRCVKSCKSTQKRNAAYKCVSNKVKAVKKITEKKTRATRKTKKTLIESAPPMIPLFASPVSSPIQPISPIQPKKHHTPTPYQFAFQDESTPFAQKKAESLSPIKERGWAGYFMGNPLSPENMKEKARYYKKKGIHGEELTKLMKQKVANKKAAERQAKEDEDNAFAWNN
jgi:hypothetical protein